MAIVSDIFNTSGSLEEVVSVILTDAIQLALIIEAILPPWNISSIYFKAKELADK